MVIPQLKPKSLYAAFDVFPSAKGSAAHIARASSTLFDYTQGGLLYCLGDQTLAAYQREAAIEIIRFKDPFPNFLQRTLAFGYYLANLLESCAPSLELVQFRDPWSGVPLVSLKEKHYRTVYEVNGLPSIELKFLYPGISSRTIEKIKRLEDQCLELADHIVTPSAMIQQRLQTLGVPQEKITVVANGADIVQTAEKPDSCPDKYIVYFGALQSWQGVDVLLQAFAKLRDLTDLFLVICSSSKPRLEKPYKKLAQKLGISERLIWHSQLSKKELDRWLVHSYLSVAPLTECDRNIQQGCCPLKILESMAAGVPVIASDLPAVREIISSAELGTLIPADRPVEWARSIRLHYEFPQKVAALGANAQQHIQENFSWKHNQIHSERIYQMLLR